jgi:hypothetical protein
MPKESVKFLSWQKDRAAFTLPGMAEAMFLMDSLLVMMD